MSERTDDYYATCKPSEYSDDELAHIAARCGPIQVIQEAAVEEHGRMTITEFLADRIAEDEAEAQKGGYHNASGGAFARDNYGCLLVQPARVLAECAAKRAIMGQHEIDLDMSEPYCDSCAEWWNCVLGEGPPMVAWPCPTLRALAAVYADHPDYQEAWR